MNAEFEEFKIEILEMLDRAEKALLEFDQMPAGQSSKPCYDEVFRAYHNIKGGAGMMDWADLQHHVHQLENVLMQSKETSSIPKHLISWFLKGNDATRAIVAGEAQSFSYDIQENDAAAPGPVTEVRVEQAEALPSEFYAEVDEGLERISATLMKLDSGVVDKSVLEALYRDIHSIKGACQLFGLADASSLSHAMESSLEKERNKEVVEAEQGHVNTLLMSVDMLGQAIKEPVTEATRKEIHFMITLLASFNGSEAAVEAKPEAKPEVKAIAVQAASAPGPVTSEADKSDTTIRVQVSLLDRLMILMGEMVLVRNQVLQYSQKNDDLEFLNLSQKLDVVTSELQEETMKTRMQPIGNILSKFQRVVRDLSGTLNKKINLNLVGVETELDKTLIEAVKDPLTHIVRNACDHGIELPEQRLAAGKPDVGTITIRAFHEGGQVIVDISDDGKGLSRQKLLNKAIERGIVDAARAEKMSDRDVHALIFAPGFSTAEKVTNVSGRGVGMDVVKSNIERIGGLVDISSSEDEGTHITLKIPLTLAIVPAMIIRSSEDRFAIPQVKLVELVRIEPAMVELVQGRPIYRLRGNILPLIDMKEVLSGVESFKEQEAINIVVLNSEGHLFGLIVDEILDTADIVVKPLARFLKPISIYSGATVLGDGSVAFILDVVGIAHKHLGHAVHQDQQVSDKYLDFKGQSESREYVLVSLAAKAKHAIPLGMVSRMEEIKTSTIELSGNQRVVRYRGGILKILNLNEVFGYEKAEVQGEITQLIVARVNEQMYGLEVDQIIDVLSTQDHFDDSVVSHEAITGNLVTQNEIIVVIDVEKLVALAQPRTLQLPQAVNGPKRILVVEDTESIRQTIVRNLEESGHEVETAVDGIDGLRRIANARANYDLIISDIEMPRMNGFELARKIRSISTLKSVPLIAFTTKNTPADFKEARDAGFTTLLEKSKGKLLGVLVSECLNKNQRKTA